MKKLTLLSVIIISTITFSQENVSNYKTSFTKQTHNVDIDRETKNIYIDALSMDVSSKEGGLILSDVQRLEFLEKIKQAKKIYSNWSKISIQNEVKEINKDMALDQNVTAYFYHTERINFQHSVELIFEFAVINYKPMIFIRTGEIKSGRNENVTSKGLIVILSDENEVDEFIDAISTYKIEEFLLKPRIEDLFTK